MTTKPTKKPIKVSMIGILIAVAVLVIFIIGSQYATN